MQNKKIAVYIRLSEEDGNVDGIIKAESNSVTAQRVLIQDYIWKNCLQRKEMIEEYVDDGYSGVNFQRPSFQRMMEDVKRGEISCILVKDFSRFGRDYLETGNYLEKIFPLLGVRFIAVNDQFDSDNCQGMTGGICVALKNIINSMYSRDLSKKVRSAMETRAVRGEYMAAFTPYGYIKNPENIHQLIPDKEAAEIVHKIFTMAADGKKKPEIARYLNEQRIPTCMEHFQKMGFKCASNRQKEKKLWTVSTIGDMLKNEAYLGKTIWNKTRQTEVGSKKMIKNDRSLWVIVEGTHQPLVSQELFYLANKKAFTHKKKPVPANRKIQPLLFCPYCGRRIALNGSNQSYRCVQASISGIPECKTIHVDRKKLEYVIVSCVRVMAEIAIKEREQKKKESLKTSIWKDEIERLEAEKRRLSARKFDFYEDYRFGRITKEIYQKKYEDISIQILEIENKVCEIKTKVMQAEKQRLQIEEQKTELEGLALLHIFDKEKLCMVIDSVQVYSEERIEIIWKMDNCFFGEIAKEKEVLSIE